MKLKRHRFLPLGLILAGLLVYISCRKIDRESDENPSLNSKSKFFTEHAPNKPLVQAINQYFKRLNDKDNFVEKTIKKIGYPRWDKAITVNFSGVLHRGASDSTELTYIPFVREEDSVVNASLLVQTSPTDTAFKYICDWQYQYEQNGLLEDTEVSAERIAFTLMTLDKEVFGHSKYKLTDSRLFENYFPDSLRGNQSYLELGTQSGNRISNRTESMAAPVTFTIYCPSCVSLYWQITYYYNLNGIPTWEFSGGGGGPGNSTPPDCPGIPAYRTEYVADPCEPGWVPIGANGYDPNAGVGVFNNFIVSGHDMTKITNWRNNNLDTIGLDSCRRELLNKLINSIGSSPLGIFLSKLDNAIGIPNTIDKFIIHFQTRPLANYNALTEHATYDEISKEFEVDIVLDSVTSKNATDIFIANTLFHEVIHAYMTFIWKKLNQGATQQQMDSLKYDQVFNAYVDTLRIRDSLNPYLATLQMESIQHNYMADKLLDFLANTIKQFDNNPTTPDKYYWYLAWAGLTRKQVRTWKIHWPNFPTWPPSNPAPIDDSTRGLKYALTLARIDTICNQVLENEEKSLPGARGKKPVTGGCY